MGLVLDSGIVMSEVDLVGKMPQAGYLFNTQSQGMSTKPVKASTRKVGMDHRVDPARSGAKFPKFVYMS